MDEAPRPRRRRSARPARSGVPFVETKDIMSTFARRPAARRDVAPPLEQLHKDILATKDQPEDSERGSVRVPWEKDPTALIRSVRSVIRRNGNKGISVATKREKGFVLFWVAPLKKRASRKKNPPMESSREAVEYVPISPEAAAPGE